MDYWKSKVLPKMKLVFVKTDGSKKAAAAELAKAFDESKEGINAEFEEKKPDLQPKVVEIYGSVPAPVKILIKDRKKTSAIKKNSAAITKLFEDLAKIEFPGAKQVSEGIAKIGPALLSGPIFATFEKVSTLLPVAAEEQSPKKEEAAAEDKKGEPAVAATEEKKEQITAVAATDEKKEEAAEEKKPEATAAAEEAAPAESAAAAEETTSAAPAADQAAPEAAAPAKAEEAPKAA